MDDLGAYREELAKDRRMKKWLSFACAIALVLELAGGAAVQRPRHSISAAGDDVPARDRGGRDRPDDPGARPHAGEGGTARSGEEWGRVVVMSAPRGRRIAPVGCSSGR